jgi:UDP-glucose 4-epimerase
VIVAVTGATGYVGRFIVKRLIHEGARVRAWRRPSSDLTGLPESIEWIEGELGSEDSAHALVEGADALVHAALAHVPGRYRGGEGDDPVRFWQLNVDGSAALLQAARDASVERAVAFSSRAVFGRNTKGPIVDDEKPSPDTHYGAVKAELEAFIKKFAKERPACALRPTGVYGVVEPAERSKWFSLVGDVLDGIAVPPRAGTEVHGDDVASATWALLQAPSDAVTGRAFNCSDIVVSHREIVRLVHEIADMSGPVHEEERLPTGIMRCDGLAALGVTFGGRSLFEKTIVELVDAVRMARGR